MLCSRPGAAGTLALSFCRQLEPASVDEALAGQAVKCLVHLSLRIYEDDVAEGRVPAVLPAAVPAAEVAEVEEVLAEMEVDGEDDEGPAAEQQEVEDEIEEEEQAVAHCGEAGGGDAEEAAAGEDAKEAESDRAEDAAGRLSLAGLVRRMARLAEDRTAARALARGAALRFVAALASRLGGARVAPYLPVMLRPLYRATEPGKPE
jgi:U3 small nucleolar RNA-associated protein 20